tara:strand:- start:107 stop:1237 length:1131 start_codon:yes stop_codon:yes gene_type:complete
MIKFLFIFLSIITVSIKTNANTFFRVDKNDYSSVERAFKTETPPLFQYKGNKFCKGGTLYMTPYNKFNKSKKSHTSGKLKSWFFSLSFGHAISSYLEGEYHSDLVHLKEDFINEYIPYLVKAAENKYFTVNKWTKGGSSVAYSQYIILINLSVFMDFMDNKKLWKTGQREKIVKWGDILYERSHYNHYANGGRKQHHRWPDTVSKAAAAYMLWGFVNKDLKKFKDGYRDLMQEYKKIPADGKYHQHFKGPYAGEIMDSWDLYLENKTLGDLVIASYVGELVGMKTFTKSNKKGGNIKKAIDYLGQISSNPNELKGQDERHLNNMRADGNSWMTVYRKLDKTDNNPLVNLHLKTSEEKGYGFSQILNFSRCIDNELK